jgi:hypothetical protein
MAETARGQTKDGADENVAAGRRETGDDFTARLVAILLRR